ncbi:hypothetical protein BDV09DRAFT_201016 [Aspergillus tetrazonus]
MSDYPANTAYAQRHIYTNPWLRKKTSLSQSQTLPVDADVDADADADAESASEEQSVSGTSASKGDKVGEDLDFDDVNTGEADDDSGSSDPRASNMQGHRQPQTTAQGRYFSASPAEEIDDFDDEYDPEILNIGAGGNRSGMREWSERD